MTPARRAALLGLALGIALAGGAAASPLRLRLAPLSREGGATDVAGFRGRPLILLFWRPDCAPCLLELRHLQSLRAAAGAVRLEAVGLAPAGELEPALARAGLNDTDSWRADADPAATLVAFGGPPPRLPLAVALTPEGRICERRLGMLGTRQAAKWGRRCGR